MEKERILTLHPEGKVGVNILKDRYDQVAEVILKVVKHQDGITFGQMADLAKEILIEQGFDGKPLWYITTVKLDLEARGLVLRTPKTSPHQLTLGKQR